MKVYIGSYVEPFRCSIYDRWLRRRYPDTWVMISDNEMDWKDRAMDRLEDVIQWVYDHSLNLFLNNRERKIKVRIDEYDTWSMDTTLAYIIVPMLRQLKDQKHGSPFVSMSDVPKELRASKEELEEIEGTGDVDSRHHDRWNWVLDEMIFAFESEITDWEEQFYSGEIDIAWVPVDAEGNPTSEGDANLWSMEDGPNHTFKIDRKGMKEYNKRIERGFKLFGKYYRNLWS